MPILWRSLPVLLLMAAVPSAAGFKAAGKQTRGASRPIMVASAPAGAPAESRRHQWLHKYWEELFHAGIILYLTKDVMESVRADTWCAIRIVPTKADATPTTISRRRAAQVTAMLGGYTPRVVFLAGLMMRSLQMSTSLRYAFDPSSGFAAGSMVAARYAQREWIGCLFVGWGFGGMFWRFFRVRPPGVAKGASPFRLL